MKLIIDLKEEDYITIINSLYYIPKQAMEMRVVEAIKVGTVIPDNATNGDVEKALFPNIEKDNERLIQEYGSQALYDTFEKWCELPYKVGDTDAL